MDVAILKASGLKVASEMLYEISGESGVKLKVRGTVPYSGVCGSAVFCWGFSNPKLVNELTAFRTYRKSRAPSF